jgi:hypothetical protein
MKKLEEINWDDYELVTIEDDEKYNRRPFECIECVFVDKENRRCSFSHQENTQSLKCLDMEYICMVWKEKKNA